MGNNQPQIMKKHDKEKALKCWTSLCENNRNHYRNAKQINQVKKTVKISSMEDIKITEEMV